MTAHHAGDASSTAMRECALPGAGIPPRVRRRVSAAVVVIAIAMMTIFAMNDGLSRAAMDASPAASPAATPMASMQGPAANIIVGEITIELTDTGFAPMHFESAVGRDVTITLENTGSRPHNFTMDELDIDFDLAPGEKATVDIPMPKLGEYDYVSNAPGDEDFSGTMVIFI